MSAFLTSPEHRNAMLHFLRVKGSHQYRDLKIYRDNQEPVNFGPWHEEKTWLEAARVLYSENIRSLMARYKDAENDPFNEAEFASPLMSQKPLAPVEAIKACDCYDYQSCETDNYKQSVACALVEMVRAVAVSALPGYDKAGWTVDDRRFSRAATLVNA